jgi:hypothetical protein
MCECKFYPFPVELDKKNRAQYVFDRDTSGGCQQCSLSEFSPKAINDDEFILRAIIFPHMLSKSNNPELTEAVIADASGMGTSVQRLLGDFGELLSRFHDIQEARAQKHRAEHPEKMPPRTYIGALKIAVSQVRDIDYIASQVASTDIRFYDTATEDDRLHGDIFLNPDKLTLKKLRVMLFSAISNNQVYKSPHLSPDMELQGFNLI